MKKSAIVFTGFMLFSLFFGAGNLIFPPLLGLQAGEAFMPAILGFLVTGVVLPFLAVFAIALSEDGLLSMGERVHPYFAIGFAIIIYLSIGALYGIPRASSVAYELGFRQIFAVDGSLALAIFSIIFFGLTFYISYNPKKIIDRIGQILTPLLLLVLATLFVQAFLKFDNTSQAAVGEYVNSPFISGFLEGYFTMDAVAALAFGIVVVNGLRDKGAKNKLDLIKGTIGSGLLAGLALALVYFCLAWIGKVIPQTETFTNGADILTASSQLLFVNGGAILFGLIVLLACLTTCVGLINACASFFHKIFPNFSYVFYAAAFSLIGLLVSNLGLEIILDIAVPLLVFIYPIAIVLIILSIVQHLIGGDKWMFRISIIVVTIFAIYDVLAALDIKIKMLSQVLSIAPFFDLGLGWVLPVVIVALCGFAIDQIIFSKKLKN